jgi:hypothetical protein
MILHFFEVVLPDELINLLEAIGELGDDGECQVRAVERVLEDHALGNLEHRNDVPLDVRGGCCGERHNGHLGELVLEDPKLLVLRPEVMAPHRHAVCLVHDEGCQLLHPVQISERDENLEVPEQLLGCQEEEHKLVPLRQLEHIMGVLGARRPGELPRAQIQL